jgi:hypothetical protein
MSRHRIRLALDWEHDGESWTRLGSVVSPDDDSVFFNAWCLLHALLEGSAEATLVCPHCGHEGHRPRDVAAGYCAGCRRQLFEV